MKRLLFLPLIFLAMTAYAGTPLYSTKVDRALSDMLNPSGKFTTLRFSDGTTQTTAGGDLSQVTGILAVTKGGTGTNTATLDGFTHTGTSTFPSGVWASNGDVAIGSTNPDHVGWEGSVLTLESDAAQNMVEFVHNDDSIVNTEGIGGLSFQAGSAFNRVVTIQARVIGTNENSGQIYISSMSNGVVVTGLSQYPSGNVGIKSDLTTDNGAQLQVVGSATVSGDLSIGAVTIGESASPARLLIVSPSKIPSNTNFGNLHVGCNDVQAINKGGCISLGGMIDSGALNQRVFGTIEGRKATNADNMDANGYLQFRVNTVLSGLTEVFRIDQNRNFGFNTSSFGTGTGMLAIANGTVTGMAAISGQGQIFCEGGELKAMDGSGNITPFSPHSELDNLVTNLADPLPHTYVSTNSYLGKKKIVNMAALIEEIEKLSGKTLVTYEDVPLRNWSTDQDNFRVQRDLERLRIEGEIDELNNQIVDIENQLSVVEEEKKEGLKKSRESLQSLKRQRNKTMPDEYILQHPPKWMQDRGVTLDL